MSWIDLGAITWWAVGLAFLVTFVFGWAYYSPQGLFPLWRSPSRELCSGRLDSRGASCGA